MNPMLCKTLLPLGLFAASLPLQLNAQLYWDTNGATAGAGATADGTWDVETTANWSSSADGDVATEVFTTGSAVVFAAGSDMTSANITVGSGVSASSLTFQEGTIALNGSFAISPSGGTTITVASGANVSTTGNITVGSSTFDIEGTLSTSIIGGGGTFTKTGSGTLILNDGANTDYSINANAGLVILQRSTTKQLKASSVGSDGTLRIAANEQFDNNLTVNGTLEVAAGITETIRGLDGSGDIIGEAGSSLVVGNAGATSTFSGTITGDLDFTKIGTGTHTFSGTNTSIGNITVSAGTYTLTDTGSITFTIGADGVNNAILGAGTDTATNLNGTFNFDLSGAEAVGGNSWLIVDVDNLAESFGSTFMVAGFEETAEDSGIWILGGYTFTESTGLLTYGAVIPEPSTFALLGGLGALLTTIRRRRPMV